MSENELDLNYYTNELPKPITHEMFNKLIKQRDQYKAESEQLKVERDTLMNELYTVGLNRDEAGDKIKELEHENEKLKGRIERLK